jgi:hypothetical protein
LNRAIVPQPKTSLSNVLPRLDRDPVVSGRESHRIGQANHEIAVPRVRILESAGNQGPWQVACTILVKENMKRRSRPGAVIFSEDIHFGDLPSLAGRYDEIVTGLAIKKI